LFEVVRGWRLGLMRQLVRVAALAAAYAAAFYGGRLVVPLVRPFLKMPDIVLSILGGALLALVVYASITSLGVIFFRRASQQNASLFRLILHHAPRSDYFWARFCSDDRGERSPLERWPMRSSR
jgi:hypothetical protein